MAPSPPDLATPDPGPPHLAPDDWRRLRDALRYQGRDLHHRSYAVDARRRELLWEEMDRCLALADRIERHLDALDEADAG
ncbi:hypothetical protein [Synechococcus sp. CCAP 1479/9]|uniref:hypothetical protein n=1 Tax=Synechococcus sp. CCAP 1479/9 TaxID=1221593 RepID=UPI001C24D7B7|nr:hypothetical protein [Synechococcus sp. CCAP 1479/9]